MAKATHTGHCQICGRKHKLPNGVLSKHGYTVDFGFFNGVCTGAGHLPFEQDISLIDDAINNVKARAKSMRKLSKELETDSDVLWVKVYYSSRNSEYGAPRGYVWETFEKDDVLLEEVEGSSGVWYKATVMPQHATKAENVFTIFPEHGDTLEKEIIKKNENRRFFYDNQAMQCDDYVSWQENRIKDWKPTELEEIK